MRHSPSIVALLSLLVLPTPALAQTETGTFRLHKLANPIGEETYSIARDGDALTIDSTFRFTDRGTAVPLNATLKAAADYTPRAFTISGRTSRMSGIDVEVKIDGATAHVRDGKGTTDVAVKTPCFTLAGYAPVALEMALLRYWKLHGTPAHLPILPSGDVEIHDAGVESVDVGGMPLAVRHYSVKGLVWGLETLWMDDHDQLVALVTRDAEFDRFEAVRTGLEAALPAFITLAARGEMEELGTLSRALPGRRTGTIAFTGATLIDGTGAAPVPNATIISANGLIVAVGPAAAVKIPKGTPRADLTGKFVVPGLWDMHAHYEQVEWGAIYLAAGVTTVRDVGNELDFIRTVRDEVDAGRGLGPRLLLAGEVDGDSPTALGVSRVNSAADAKAWVKKFHDAGFQQMKIYSSMTSENVKAVAAEAHALGMTVTGHIPQGMDIYDGINDGMDQVNHIQYVTSPLVPKPAEGASSQAPQGFAERLKATASIDVASPAAEKLLAFLKQHGTVIDDTGALLELLLHPADEPVESFEPGISKVAPELRAQLTGGGVPPGMAGDAKQSVERMLEVLGALHKAGIPIVAGTDQCVPGFSVYRELELYVQAGFTPMEALQAATIVPARVMKVESEAGTVERGKRADLAILERNPLEDIHNIRTVRAVVADGVVYDSAPLWTSVGFTP